MLAAEAGIARAAPRQTHVGGPEGVHPDGAGLEPARESMYAGDVAAPHAGGEIVDRAVGDSECVLFFLERNDRRDRAKYLLLGDAHLVGDAGEHRGFYEVARLAAAFASGHNRGPLAAADVDVIQD